MNDREKLDRLTEDFENLLMQWDATINYFDTTGEEYVSRRIRDRQREVAEILQSYGLIE